MNNNKTNAKPYSDCEDLIITLENAEQDAIELNALLNVCYCAADADKSGDFAHDIARSVGVLSAMSDNLLAGASAALRKARGIERGGGWTFTITGKGLAALAATNGGEELRRYCDYLKAHGYKGDPHKYAAAFSDPAPLFDWAVGSAYRDCVKDDDDLRAFMLGAGKGAADV